ncbi:Sugar lactone lactonase YvrE [Streptoalloteichus tenebrarius]|uniref:Sugar lactone lactonase YvrE n=1 Tax=Streptoalloteichus tenebrarius (strain ATCC 17920 / DSM 40477 / JCM 4838 / CBS 697.72 / NBRC 16177 / NCIMB 11028 / NRRL B-12390 / A12253. 1 / ISP 5477) TaxID=1933 RepID=A0ABT1HMP0_STRSD|nr:SMP-30/gluconolactonase/LRE family protein [Streptoalloteichus tenebrarius]MCP2256786.1 Sugar lactone lactonase YvrE [Streptoalloteichus tenebrarius]BFF00309.1 SMP-30/gluconolactonase/LRE family protein [Streptoalloteichus tenebrarius]
MKKAEVLLDGLRFAEGPRTGPDGRLYVSDFYDRHVLAVDVRTGAREVVCEVPGQPSGLGWLPDGRMLVVSMLDRTVWRLEPDGRLTPHADLSGVATFHANDMLVRPDGRAYVGNFGFDLHGLLAERGLDAVLASDAEPPTATLALVEPDGEVRPVADGLRFPNGMVALSDGTLVLAETLGLRLLAFDVAEDGSLSGRRVWADLRERLVAPDGVCVDVEDRVWVSAAVQPSALRVAAGGQVMDQVATSQNCFAVGLTGPDRRTLVCCTAPSSLPRDVAERRLGRLEVAEVDVPGV